MIKYNSAYVTLLSTWLILGTIVNPTKMLPYASILMTFISFVGAKYATLVSIREEARDVIQDIVKDEFQRMVSKTDIQNSSNYRLKTIFDIDRVKSAHRLSNPIPSPSTFQKIFNFKKQSAS